jgi:uncharacterized membrane protein
MMTIVGWFEIWVVIFFIVGIVFAYRIGLLVELRWPSIAGPLSVLLGLTVLIVSWMAAVQVTGKEQAGCDEVYVTTDRLNGSSRSEFRERCIATLRPGDLAWR